MSRYVAIEVEDGIFQAYLAEPAAPLAPAVVVLHEVFGVNADLRQTCDELAPRASWPSALTCSGASPRASIWA